MKKVFFIFALLMLVVAAQAQFGIKAGVNTASFKIESADQAISEAKDATWGFHAGIFYRLKIAMLYLQPEAYFSSTGGSFTYDNGIDTPSLETIDLKRIDIPLLLGVKLGPIRLNAGPVGMLKISEDYSLDGMEADLKGMTWGWQGGLGFDLFGKLAVDASYEGPLTEVSNTINLPDFADDLEPSTKQSQFLISVGFMF